MGRSEGGRWWLIDPDNRPMIYKGCNAVLRQVPGQAGEYLYFQWVEQRYGDDIASFIADAVAVLREAGFNGFGGWSMLFTPREGHRELGMPFVEIISSRELAGPERIVCGNIDVFDEHCWRRIDRRFQESWAELKDNRNLLGYFCDNECMYGQPMTDSAWTGRLSDLDNPPAAPTLLQEYLALPPDRAGHRAAWDWVLQRHDGQMARLARDWQAPFTDPAALRALTHEHRQILTSDGYSRDHVAFTRLYVREYYRRQHEIIRRYDPHHLIMTTRCPAPPEKIVLEEMHACFKDGLIDVLAMNCYRDRFFERIDEFYRVAPMPVLNGEFSWCSGHFLDWGRFLREERFSEEEKEQIRLRGRMALERAFTHPGLIGYTWFKWYSGREFTQDEYGLAKDQPFGAVVNNHGELNTFNAALFRQIHPRLEAIARGGIEPFYVEGLPDRVGQTI
ncbi:MAG: hypothetical protein JJU36_09080 [Phycisphaeraceae bacterium]|nr:hypothetical protein [Phycisphaeraceae bacterium]